MAAALSAILLCNLTGYILSYMLIRTVRMTFRPDAVDEFMRIYAASSPHIRAFPGCRHLELWRDARYSNILTTCSHWDGADDLERYRASTLFRDTWSRTKPLFAALPEAHSYYTVSLEEAG
jgi:quinol monooxygenase YgiN